MSRANPHPSEASPVSPGGAPAGAAPRHHLTALWIGAAGIAPGFVTTLFVLAGPHLRGTFHLTYDRMGLLLSVAMVGQGAASLVGGILLDAVAVAWVARAALLTATAACLLAASAANWLALAGAALLFGCSGGVLGIIPMVLFTEMYPADRTRTMTRWQFAVSVAAIAAPMGMGFLLEATTLRWGAAHGWRAILAGLAPIFLVLLATAPARRLNRAAPLTAARLGHVAAALASPGLAVALVLAMLHAAGDNTAYFWIVLMVKQRFRADAAAAGLLITGYSAAYAAGRALRGVVRWPWAPLPTIAAGSGAGAALLVLATRAPTFGAALALYVAAGLLFSLNWPSLLGYAGDRFPQQLGVVLGTLWGVTGIATLIVSSATGVVSRVTGNVSVGMLVPSACFLGLSALAALACRREATPPVEENEAPAP